MTFGAYPSSRKRSRSRIGRSCPHLDPHDPLQDTWRAATVRTEDGDSEGSEGEGDYSKRPKVGGMNNNVRGWYNKHAVKIRIKGPMTTTVWAAMKRGRM